MVAPSVLGAGTKNPPSCGPAATRLSCLISNRRGRRPRGKARKGVISPRGAVLGMALPRPKLGRLVIPERGKIQPKHRPQLGLKAPEQANTQAASSGDF
jgi:hypothetical protein